jgi:hypothetical protein
MNESWMSYYQAYDLHSQKNHPAVEWRAYSLKVSRYHFSKPKNNEAPELNGLQSDIFKYNW